MTGLQLIPEFRHAREIAATDQTLIVYEEMNQEDFDNLVKYRTRYHKSNSELRLEAYSAWLTRNHFQPAYRIVTLGGRGRCLLLGGVR